MNNRSRPFHGGQPGLIAEQFGIDASQLLDFSANIHPDGPSLAVLSALQESCNDLSAITCYPDLHEVVLKQSLASYAGVRPENIVVANGFVQLLDVALRSLPIRKCLFPVPAFVEYRHALTLAHVEAVAHALMPERDFYYDTGRLLDGDHDAILLANPQNPSGVAAMHADLHALISAAAERNIFILLDEAFIDYVAKDSFSTKVEPFPNLIGFRSVTKFFGIPGLRVAYAVANRQTAAMLNENLPPWPITTLASRAVCAALEDKSYAASTIQLNSHRRTQLKKEIEALGVYCYPSAANFLLLRFEPSVDVSNVWKRLLLEHGIVLRSCTNYENLNGQHLRAAVRRDDDNGRLIEALSKIL